MKTIFNSNKKNIKDFGFGRITNEQRRLRLINKDGSFNVDRKGLGFLESLSIYHLLLDISWPKFILFSFAGYLILNLFFASLYFIIDDKTILGQSDEVNKFLNSFFFSIQTSSTIGFGKLVPTNLWANIIVTLESFIGILSVAITTGLMFARFSKPNAKIKYSSNALIAPYKDGFGLMIRLVNVRKNQLFELDAQLNIVLLEKRNNKIERKFYRLDLEISHLTFFPLSWTLVHSIDKESPLTNLSEKEFFEAEPEIYVFIKGVDDTFNQYVYSRTSYKADEIIYNAKFVSIYNLHEINEKISIDISKLSRFEKLKEV